MEVLKESQKKNRERSSLSKDVFGVVDGCFCWHSTGGDTARTTSDNNSRISSLTR